MPSQCHGNKLSPYGCIGTRGSKQRTQQWACSERRVCFKHCTHTYGKFHTGEVHRDSTRMLLQINNPEKSTFHFVPKAETPSGWSVLAFHIIANHFQNVCGGVCVHACRYIPTYRCALQKRVLVGLLYYFLPFPKRHGLSLSLELRWLTACKHQ